MDPSRVKISEAMDTVDLTAKENKKVIKMKSNKNVIGYVWTYFVVVKEPRDINSVKVSKALKHLIKLCGGKDELF